MKLVVKIALGIMLAFLLLIAGCTALIGSAANDPEVKKAVSDLEDISGTNDVNYQSKIRQVKIGMTRAQLIRLMGSKPRDQQVMESEYGTSEFLYWGSYQVSLQDGVVDGKSKF